MFLRIDVPESQRTVVVPSKPTLRRELADRVVRIAQSFQSDILLSANLLQVNAKSPLLALMALGILKGRSLVLKARGKDAKQAVQALSRVFETKASETKK
jgi:phosphotransferase system HPr (HPr) family protein